MSAAPKLSVLVPTYGYARFLPALVRSILDQDFRDFELIVADDASPDGSGDAAAAAAAGDARARVFVHRRNLGMVENWNWCLGQASGELVKFVFGDDLLTSRSALGTLAGLLDANPGCSLAACTRHVIDDAGAVERVRNDFGRGGSFAGAQVAARCLWSGQNLIGGPSCVMFRRAPAARGFDPALRQLVDLEMWLHLLARGGFVYHEEPLCALRRHPRQQSHANMRSGIGPVESAIIAARYYPVFGGAGLGWARRLELRAHSYRLLYDLRKAGRRTPAAQEAERVLRAAVPPAWRPLLWVWRKVARPIQRLARCVGGRP
jgi:glycosyltransferase involved in cell wall biosynthesis